MRRIVVVGEGMLELGRAGGDGLWRLGYGGDTLNTAIHLARLGHDVAFMSALGTNRFSEDLRARWASEGLDTSLIASDPLRFPGLYAIDNDPDGERHFSYWRGESAARQLFALAGAEERAATAAGADLLLFSMISLAILPAEGRTRLLDLARAVRSRGGRVAFDTNYRPRLWPDLATAQAARHAALKVADIGLPTLEDETLLTAHDDAAAVAAEWQGAGVSEVVVKGGERGAFVGEGWVAPPAMLAPIDTSGAGDAFNAGYLHARLGGADPSPAALAGHVLAGWVVMRPGAIPADGSSSPYASLRD